MSGADGRPGVVLVVGVNGSGKTTTVGKISRILVAEDRSVVLGAADTFRAAAVEQLATWGERVGVDVVRGPEGTDPASVAFDAVKEGVDTGADTVIVDTAGRLQNKAGPDGRARQGQAGHREAGSGHRGAARPRRHHRPERH